MLKGLQHVSKLVEPIIGEKGNIRDSFHIKLALQILATRFCFLQNAISNTRIVTYC